MVASLTRLIPPVIANRRKRRLKCALTVRRAILSCRAISELSQPCSSSSAICCSRGPSRMELSFISASPLRSLMKARFGQLLIEVSVPGTGYGIRVTPDFQIFGFLPKFIACTVPSLTWISVFGGKNLDFSQVGLGAPRNGKLTSTPSQVACFVYITDIIENLGTQVSLIEFKFRNTIVSRRPFVEKLPP